jgi:hypothetical protein
MSSAIIQPTVEGVLTAHVMDDRFCNMMNSVASQRRFACVIYGGRLYDFDTYSRAVKGNFESGVSTLSHHGSDGLLASLLSYFLTARPSLRLFMNDYVHLQNPFPSCVSSSQEGIQSFIDRTASMPCNLLVAEGESFDLLKNPCIAIADISDGEAWLFVSSEP